MERKVYNGSYYEMFAVCDQDEIVGLVSLYKHSEYIISAGLEIYMPYRKKGYGYEALMLAYNYAKDLGYKIASAQIRTENGVVCVCMRNWDFSETVK